MNLLGKSLTFVIFVLSVAFMLLGLVVNASYRNWREVVLGDNGLKAQIENIEKTNEQLRDARQRIQADLDRERAARRTALAALQSELSTLDERLTASASQVQTLSGKNTTLQQENTARAQSLQAKEKQVTDLRELLRKEQEDRDQLFQDMLAISNEITRLKGLYQNQSQRAEQLASQLTRYKEVTDAKGININDPLDGAPPERNGTVLVVDRPEKVVEVSIGADDGLRPGHRLDVTRNGRYVTKLRVKFTEPDRAVGEILTDYNNLTIEKGDRVDTTIE